MKLLFILTIILILALVCRIIQLEAQQCDHIDTEACTDFFSNDENTVLMHVDDIDDFFRNSGL